MSGIALWPNALGWPPRASFDADSLPMSAKLRTEIESWLSEQTGSMGDPDPSDHDRRGHALSLRLQEELGAGYLVEYGFHTDQDS